MAEEKAFLSSHTGCKSFSDKSDPSEREFTVPANLECAEYIYDGNGNLALKHVNSCFNCCPGELGAEFSITENKLVITEYETEGLCCCLCLYDLDYRINGIKPGVYTIIIRPKNPGINKGLKFTADLNFSVRGRFCEKRSSYPWK